MKIIMIYMKTEATCFRLGDMVRVILRSKL